MPALFFAILVAGERVGSIQLRLGATTHLIRYGGQIGYEIHPKHRGHAYAASALRALLPVAAQRGFTEIWITCRTDNLASIRTLEKAGAQFVETVSTPPDTDMFARGDREMRRYRMPIQLLSQTQA